MKSIKLLFLSLLIAFSFSLNVDAYNFTRDLEFGARGEDVTQLQQILTSSGYLPSDLVTGYFGESTKNALIRWQTSLGISPAAGYFGALSRAVAISVPIGNLSANSISYQVSSFLTLDQAKYAVDTLVKAKLISRRKSDLALNLLVGGNNPQIPIMKLNPRVTLLDVKDSGRHEFEVEAAVPTDSIKTWMYTFAHDGLVRITPEGRDVLEEAGVYIPRNNGESFDIKFTADNLNPSTEEVEMLVRGYSSPITSHNQDYLVAEGTVVFKVTPKPVVLPVKLNTAQICAVVQKPTTSTCVRSYPIFKGTEKMAGYMYNGFKYDIFYKKYANSEGAVCRDTCTANVY